MCGFIAQLVEHRTGIAEVTGSNPVEALIFFRLLLSNCLNWKIYCDDHISLLEVVEKVFLVCFPLISLAKNQVSSLNEKGVKAAVLGPGQKVLKRKLRASSYEPGQPGWLGFRDLASPVFPS